jgi:hypothetical protein
MMKTLALGASILLSLVNVAAAESPQKQPAQKASTTVAPKLDAATLVRSDPAMRREQTRRLANLTAADRAKLAAAARALVKRMASPMPKGAKPRSLEDTARDVVLAGGFASDDIASLAMLVMMAAANDAREDLKSVMAKVKAINDAKACKTKQCLTALKPTADYDQATLDLVVDQAQGKLDSLSEMGETDSLRLQMAMDRMSKMMSTLSNIMKKTSDTEQSMTSNLK